MRAHSVVVIAAALVIGVVGFMVFFGVGSYTGSGTMGIVGAAVVYMLGGLWLQRQRPASWWYAGAAINAPIWIFFLGPADPGQFQLYVTGLVGCLAAAYVGAFIGSQIGRSTEGGTLSM